MAERAAKIKGTPGLVQKKAPTTLTVGPSQTVPSSPPPPHPHPHPHPYPVPTKHRFRVEKGRGVDDPGGCILTHDPGSGKTSMIISLTQSFLTQYSHARPLVILLKGILGTWKREFQIWQMEDLPLLGFYTVEADNRAKQLEMLKKWVEQKSLLLLEYKQFSSIACDRESSPISIACQKVLLKQPSTLIPDEGHTPKNEDIDVLQSLSKVQIELVKKTETPTKPEGIKNR
ncbi:hypothetical protein LWI29_011323 [Acer saccharum]|uniref:SNF2 N-terminal domain-containing protein n=1 Tax=Acer saccharum TaxID=4024 RepID=A0AA39VC19_ACESA|nr:hypothetical protein LWI29_011323 [Acer saccharum]